MLVGVPGFDRGWGDLDEILKDPRGKRLIGVMGYSLGAGTVAAYYAYHTDTEVGFWLNEGAGLDPWFATFAFVARDHENYAGETPWNGGGSTSHIPHNAGAPWIIGALAVTTRQ